MDTTMFAATKLRIPMPVRHAVARPNLVQVFDQRAYRVGVVSAPAGFGKSALLAMWAATQGDAVAWLSCDGTDVEPARFWGGLLAAVGVCRPGVGDDARILLERQSAESPAIAVSLANDLGASDAPLTIVIDDLHLAEPSPAVLAGLLAALPTNVRLLIGSRTDPPLPLARLRVAGALLELRSDDLCFSAAETSAVLLANGVSIDAQQSKQLHALTEGWPAGVQLAALALQRDAKRSKFLESFASTDRAVADFLVGEVLDRLPAPLVEFLYMTSVLDGFDAALCESVTGRDDAAGLLDQVVAADLFVVRLDVGAGWYRYHHLFGAFLQARLRGLGRARWRDVHGRAAEAFEARGDIVSALRHTAAAGDEDEAAAIVRRTLWRWITVIDPVATETVVRQWLHTHGRGLISTDPVQVLDFLLPVITTTYGDDLRWWLTEIDAAHPEASPTLTAVLQGNWGEHHLCRGASDQAVSCFEAAMAAVAGAPPVDGPLTALPMGLARAHLQNGNPAVARAILDTVEARPTGHRVIDDVRVPAMQSWIAFLDGELRRTEQVAQTAITRADEMGLGASDLSRIFTGLSIAGLHVERHDDEVARELLDQLRHAADLGRRPSLQSLVALEHARYARLVGDETTAAADLTLARLLLPGASSQALSMFDVEAARQAIEFRPNSAAALIDSLVDDSATTMLRLRLALVEGDRRTAAELLATVAPPVTPRARVARGVLEALTHHHRDVEAANRALNEALLVARTEGFRRTILEQGPEVLTLLLSFSPTRELEPLVGELIDIASSTAAPIRPRPVTSLVEPLSDREVTVLRFLCSRLTYHEIAAALYVSHNTLKSHVSSIYRKLAVGSRSDAVEAGRQLRII